MSLPMQSRAVVAKGMVPDFVASCKGANMTSGSGSWFSFFSMAARAFWTSSASCLFLPEFAARMSREDTTNLREVIAGAGDDYRPSIRETALEEGESRSVGVDAEGGKAVSLVRE